MRLFSMVLFFFFFLARPPHSYFKMQVLFACWQQIPSTSFPFCSFWTFIFWASNFSVGLKFQFQRKSMSFFGWFFFCLNWWREMSSHWMHTVHCCQFDSNFIPISCFFFCERSRRHETNGNDRSKAMNRWCANSIQFIHCKALYFTYSSKCIMIPQNESYRMGHWLLWYFQEIITIGYQKIVYNVLQYEFVRYPNIRHNSLRKYECNNANEPQSLKRWKTVFKICAKEMIVKTDEVICLIDW